MKNITFTFDGDKMKRIIYIGFITNNDNVYASANSFAGNDAELQFIIEGIYKNEACLLEKVISYGHNIFKKSNRFFRKQCTFKLNIGKKTTCDCTALTIINIPVIKQIVAAFNLFFVLNKTVHTMISKGVKADDIIVITCNTYPLFSFATYISKKFFKFKMGAWLIDGFYDIDSASKRHRFNAKIALHMLRKYEMVIALCKNILDDYCSEKQRSVSITPVYENTKSNPEAIDVFANKTFNIMFAGGIAQLNGIVECIEAAKLLKGTCNFNFWGRGALADYLEKAAEEVDNIFYWGVTQRENILQYEKQADILVIIRPTTNGEQNNITKYGIPYKLIEYLQSGTPVVATRMLAIPKEFDAFINYCDGNPEAISKLITHIKNNYDIYKEKAIKGMEYLADNCNWNEYRKVIGTLINNI